MATEPTVCNCSHSLRFNAERPEDYRDDKSANLPYGRGMALTSNDETDLILPLMSGVHENPAFSAFLSRLRRRSGADFASLLLRQSEVPGAPLRVHFDASAPDRDSEAPSKLAQLDCSHLESLRMLRVYTIAELVEHDPVARSERRQKLAQARIADERVVRLNEFAWLGLIRASGRCSASDSALLSSLAPYVAGAVALREELAHERSLAKISALALARSHRGWIALDADGRVLDIDPAVSKVWSARHGIAPRRGERLRGLSRQAERELLGAAQTMAADRTSPAHALRLTEEHEQEALLLPCPDTGDATLLLLLPLPYETSGETIANLGALHGLPPREAELALSLAQGRSIAEAAQAMGLTLETARNYSKRIYAKLGVSGHPQLVHKLHEGAALMA